VLVDKVLGLLLLLLPVLYFLESLKELGLVVHILIGFFFAFSFT